MPAKAPTKDQLRSAMRRRLAALDPETATGAATRVADSVLGLPEVASAATVLCCLSFGDELDTHALIERIADRGQRVVLPRCVEGARDLSLHPFPCPLETLAFGLAQPERGTPAVEPTEVDIALLVGLAFDHRLYRLGHGGGYFDRFLAAHAIPAIGIAYRLQIVEQLPRRPHDIPMSRVVTEDSILA